MAKAFGLRQSLGRTKRCTGWFFQDFGSGDSDSLRWQRKSSLNSRFRVQPSWLGPRGEHAHHSWDVTTIHPVILVRARLAIAALRLTDERILKKS
jgi:hypothetical protein